MDFKITGKTALITGSSKGIGLQIAKTLHKEGCQVILNSRNQKDLEKQTKLLEGSIGISGDVTSSNQAHSIISNIIDTFGKLDILVCNVGSGKSVPPGEENLKEWVRMINLNLYSTTNMVEASAKYLSLGKGKIVCISSICGNEIIPGAPITYSASKAALNSYVRGISRPLAEKGVRINAILPGNIFFKGSTWEGKLDANPELVKRFLTTEVPLKSFGTPEDIANLVCYLVSPVSNFMTGSLLNLDGGQVRG